MEGGFKFPSSFKDVLMALLFANPKNIIKSMFYYGLAYVVKFVWLTSSTDHPGNFLPLAVNFVSCHIKVINERKKIFIGIVLLNPDGF